ncbi:D-alanine--D-alanine ligase [hydrothermal vent metagenome]|uniref:D-alanine--D-alanine ligase n=1 Tax=hydrothermal vent metagenome TaxID=652676 RepID=A0A3B0ZE15_9ZZZZ
MTVPADYGRVAVVMGGNSTEREISLQSGNAVLASLLRSGVDAVGIDTQNGLSELVKTKNIDRVFIALHGRGGEDGAFQGAMSCLNLPYTGSDVLGSALAMDKLRTKQVWDACQLPTPSYIEATSLNDMLALSAKLTFPVALKPINEGSSIGISKVMDKSALSAAWQAAVQYDTSVLAEQWIEGDEYTVAVLNEKALPIIKLETDHIFYDYEAKYTSNDTQYIFPCGLSSQEESNLHVLALKAFSVLGCSGWGRVDFMVDKAGQAWLLEVNTIPGMTDHSLVPMAAHHAGLSFDQLVLAILDTSFEVKSSK